MTKPASTQSASTQSAFTPPVLPAQAVDQAERPPRSQWRDVWSQFSTHTGAMVGAAIFVCILLFVFLGPWVWKIDPGYANLMVRNHAPSSAFLFGTDELGRDLMARMMAGGKVSIAVGLTAMSLSILVGTLVGISAGFFRKLDNPLMRLTDLFLALPLLPLLLVMVMLFREPLSAAFGPEGGIFILMVVSIGVTSWMQTARIVRGEVLALKEREFVLAARSIGTPSLRLILRHILPNTLSPIMVSATLGIASAIIIESALSFLGLGFPPDFPTWGRLLFDAVDQMQLYPNRVFLPGLAISLTVLSINYIGDGLRDALDPRIRGR